LLKMRPGEVKQETKKMQRDVQGFYFMSLIFDLWEARNEIYY
jgi:hypothetical protein